MNLWIKKRRIGKKSLKISMFEWMSPTGREPGNATPILSLPHPPLNL